MSVSDEVPDQWHPFFEARGFESFHDLAKSSKVAVSTVIATLRAGGRSPKDSTVAKVADALGTTAARVRELRGDPVLEPFTLPNRADQLDPTERRAVLTVVDALLRARGATHVDQSRVPADSSASSGAPAETRQDKEGGGSPDHTESGATLDALSGAGIAELQVDGVDDDGQKTG